MAGAGAARLLALALVGLLGAGCVPEMPEPVATTAAADPVADEIGEARELIADPVTQLAAGVLDVARRVDFIRHEVARGEPMHRAIQDLRELADEVVTQAEALESLVGPMDGVLQDAADAVTAMVEESRRVIDLARADVDGLTPLVELDAELAQVIDGWDGRGSRSESEARFADLLADADAVVARARGLTVQPAACAGPRTNRISWAKLLRSRTIQLRDLALVADGVVYDELRARFELAPYGEDRVAADAESRACWAGHSPLLDVPDRVGSHLDDVEQALSGPG